MDQGFDTGPIAHIHKIAIREGETYGVHNKRLAWETVQGVGTFTQTLMLLGNAVPLTPQGINEAQYFNRPTAKDLAIDWATMNAKQIQYLVNACNPWNKGAFARFGNIVFKIIQVSVKEHLGVYNQQLIPGSVINCSEKKTIDIVSVDNNILSIEVISVDEGIFTADFLVKLGLKKDMGRSVFNFKPFFLLLLVAFFLSVSATKAKSQTTLARGDVAFLAMQENANLADTFVIVLLKNIASGTEIRFTDGNWNDANNYISLNNSSMSEWMFTWQATSAMNA
eukprot:gene8095-10965_t